MSQEIILSIFLETQDRSSLKGHPCTVKIILGTPVRRPASAPSIPILETIKVEHVGSFVP